MEPVTASERMAALAQATRLDAFMALGRELPEGLSVGQLAEMLGTPKNTMSAHLGVLARSGLIGPTRAGTTVTYFAKPEAVRDLARFLTGTVLAR